jgi:hypothetical protein
MDKREKISGGKGPIVLIEDRNWDSFIRSATAKGIEELNDSLQLELKHNAKSYSEEERMLMRITMKSLASLVLKLKRQR